MIVLGLGFGDEGKGVTTSFLCSQLNNPIVVRFNGGHQAGHTVFSNGVRHVFSNFGSGTLDGHPTLWSHFCTFSPESFLKERLELNNPEFYIHALCPVTTPYDILFNRQNNKTLVHGSCGVGFGATLKRQEAGFKLFVQDLFYDKILFEKLNNIAKFYQLENLDINPYLDSILMVRKFINLVFDYSILQKFNPVFEGAQGILLDMDFGFFPNVTPSNTTSKNALAIYPSQEIYYVSRTYQTRHGNGFMSNEHLIPELSNFENETNVLNEHQGKFRKSILDLDLLNYSLQCDNHFSDGLKKNLVITCADHTNEFVKVTRNDSIISLKINDIPDALNNKFDNLYISKGPSKNDFIKIK